METKTVIRLLNDSAIKLSPYNVNLADEECVIYCADTNKFNASRAVLKSTIAEGADVIARQTKRAREAIGFGGEVK